jgi:AmiR/NasT family two-component response regulator
MDDSLQMTIKVAQASGMVAVQADCSVEAAITLMEARAAATRRSLEEIAEGVVEGSVWFD